MESYIAVVYGYNRMVFVQSAQQLIESRYKVRPTDAFSQNVRKIENVKIAIKSLTV